METLRLSDRAGVTYAHYQLQLQASRELFYSNRQRDIVCLWNGFKLMRMSKEAKAKRFQRGCREEIIDAECR
jgi:hypothetical protein